MKLRGKLNMDVVGGGPDAFLGEVLRKATRIAAGIDLASLALAIGPLHSKQMRRTNVSRRLLTYAQKSAVERRINNDESKRITENIV
jgi:hypothetical protein